MDFKTATDRLASANLTLDDVAEAAGVTLNTISRARLDPSSDSYRSPPPNWREALIRLARDRGGELAGLAEELEAEE